MGNVSFVLCEPDDLTPQAQQFLTSAQRAVNGYFTLDMAISEARAGVGLFYNVVLDAVLVGCLFIDFRVIHLGKVMQLALLGGVSLKDWGEDLVYFLHKIARDYHVSEFTILSRPGWGRMFKELEHVGCIFRRKL